MLFYFHNRLINFAISYFYWLENFTFFFLPTGERYVFFFHTVDGWISHIFPAPIIKFHDDFSWTAHEFLYFFRQFTDETPTFFPVTARRVSWFFHNQLANVSIFVTMRTDNYHDTSCDEMILFNEIYIFFSTINRYISWFFSSATRKEINQNGTPEIAASSSVCVK